MKEAVDNRMEADVSSGKTLTITGTPRGKHSQRRLDRERGTVRINAADRIGNDSHDVVNSGYTLNLTNKSDQVASTRSGGLYEGE